MGFDIQYLLLLQQLRNATGGIFNEFFNAISKFAVDILPFLPFVVFWSVDKKWGWRFIATLAAGEFINGIIKLTVCAYRPWIRSELIEPAGDSKVAATGYSFPSGHTMCGTTLYGTVFVWQKDKRRWLAVLMAVMIFLTGFSRNFLGVHTPQDVIVGFLESILIIFVIGVVSKKLEGNEKLIDIVTLAGVAVVALGILYIKLKPYPMDYVDGALLVDPQKMMVDTFKGCGCLLGLIIGSYADRHYLKYEIPEGSKNLPLLTATGAALMFSWKQFFGPATVTALFGPQWGNLLSMCMMTLFGIIIWPLVIKGADRKEEAAG